ncbi:MAG: phosphoribosylamine--glycine ligase [Acidobacteriota bacterium]|nr:phosphoribosylamine--glycine ligase [Acidobacteriota bacterium]MDH3522050.1 phosphoribosylamine--glycine ligase [Acidobacteriota bacterium]
MKILVVGGGGREHALCWKLAGSPLATKIYCAPGNPGIAAVAECVEVSAADVAGLTDLAVSRDVDLTVVGPEVPLTLGLADLLAGRGRLVFGPGREAARLEGSKVFAKEFMRRHGIPTADFEVVESLAAARRAVARFGLPAVLKADGLAAGKGVLIPRDEAELEAALRELFVARRFGAAADRVVVEECLAGEEVSLIAVSDGRRLRRFATAKDYKRIGEGDTGPNTGGMGAHSPSAVLPEEAAAGLERQVLQPVVDGMAAAGHPFVGVLYGGLMLTAAGPRVLEYNVRFGDPECQPLMLRLAGDLLPVLLGAARGDFGAARLEFDEGAAACVVLASAGYPATPAKGDVITGLDDLPRTRESVLFHAGTSRRGDGSVVASGGRVLNACGRGADLGEALARAYALADAVDWPAKVLRRDIGRRILDPGTGV